MTVPTAAFNKMTEERSGASQQAHSEIDPLSDPEERRILYATLDSFRYVHLFIVCSIRHRIASRVSAIASNTSEVSAWSCRLMFTTFANPVKQPDPRKVLVSFVSLVRQYRHAAHYNTTHLRRQSFYSLPNEHVELLSSEPFSLPATFRAVDDAIDSNADISEAILQAGLLFYNIEPTDESWHGKATVSDLDKARSTIRQLYRDWSAEGSQEREACWAPIRSALQSHLASGSIARRHRHKVLIPGAGLGRLVLELCREGYSVEGNELSYHQLLASNYMLNHIHTAGQHMLYPWALSFSNHSNRANQLRSVPIPDVEPSSELHFNERMTMTAGDFCDLYRRPENSEAFDAVTTCFFIDTAPNVIHYIETIRSCLKAGGIWANVGPLLWHFESAPTPAEKEKDRKESYRRMQTNGTEDDEKVGLRCSDRNCAANQDIGDPGSFELSNDEIITLVSRLGFEILEQSEKLALPAGYIQDRRSMLQNIYQPSFWVAKKID